MTLEAPNLDSRTFEQLMAEAKARIPHFTPEWTNFNRSDPGMTIIELQAWLAETILHELNRVPELNYVKFLDLLGVAPEPARPARTEVSFALEKLDQPDEALVVPVPIFTKMGVDDPDLGQEVTFETDRSLLALNADFGVVLVPTGAANPARAMVTRYDKTGAVWLHAFHPFGAPPAPGRALYVGLVLRPNLKQPLAQYLTDALPAGPLDLYVELAETGDPVSSVQSVPALNGQSCASQGLTGPRIDWQIYTGPDADLALNDAATAGWTPVALSSDGTQGMAVSGHVVLELPPNASAVDPATLSAEDWQSFGALKPPRDAAELLAVLDDIEDVTKLGDFWPRMGVTDAGGVLAACGTDAARLAVELAGLPAEPRPELMTLADWLAVDPGFATALPVKDDAYRPLFWLRAIYRQDPEPGAAAVAMARRLRLNTVAATQAASRKEDRLGLSNGRPGQSFALPATPVLIDPGSGAPDLELNVGGDPGWQRVADFHASRPADRHFVLDPVAGRIGFGDGLHGQIPVAGAAILVNRYRTGGGAVGNVGPDTIIKLKGKLRGVKAVTNPRAAHDGANAETMAAVRLRAPHDLRHQDRAVSADDFADLALRSPGAALHKAVALARRGLDAAGTLVAREGAVTLILLPQGDGPMPLPTAAQYQAVCRWLEPRRLITTELHLAPPRYAVIEALALRIWVRDGHDITTTSNAIYAALLTFLHPIRGGQSGTGWEFGEAIYHADLYDRVLAQPGVRRAAGLSIRLAGQQAALGDAADITVIGEAGLPALARDKITLVAGYD